MLIIGILLIMLMLMALALPDLRRPTTPAWLLIGIGFTSSAGGRLLLSRQARMAKVLIWLGGLALLASVIATITLLFI
jgi:hypothetical protein